MGGSSRSQQTQNTSSSSVQQSFVDNSDNSDNSRVDIYTDNSDNSRSDFYQDNSDNSRVDISNSGTAAGAIIGGNLSVIDGGAFGLVGDVAGYMRDVAETGIKQATEQTFLATQSAGRAVDSALTFGREAIISNENVSKSAISGVTQAAGDSIAGMLANSRYAIDGMTESTALTANALRNASQDAIASSNAAMERNAALIQTTALGGQDLVIDMAKKIGIAAVVAVGLSALTFMFKGK